MFTIIFFVLSVLRVRLLSARHAIGLLIVKFQDYVARVVGDTVMGEQGVEDRADDTTLRCINIGNAG